MVRTCKPPNDRTRLKARLTEPQEPASGSLDVVIGLENPPVISGSPLAFSAAARCAAASVASDPPRLP
eukprot:371308-Hanusia_phi.AAC.2